MATLTADDIASKSQDLAYFHNALFKISADRKILASCVSFAPRDRVPPGSLHNVGIHVHTYTEWSNAHISVTSPPPQKKRYLRDNLIEAHNIYR